MQTAKGSDRNMKQIDMIIIGSGQGGVPLAEKMAEDGKEVVVFERANWGGSCINYGCTPSKSFLASAHSAHTAKNSGNLGVHAEVTIDFPQVMNRIREKTSQWSEGVKQRLVDAGVQVVEAEASFNAPRIVAAAGETYQAPIVVINTGKSPRIPGIPGLEDVPYRTFKSFWGLEQLPKKTLILGGGFISMELGQGLARLGSEVHIVEKMDAPIHQEEKEVTQTLKEALEEDGVVFHLDAEVTEIDHSDGTFTIGLVGEDDLTGDMLLIAAGRVANSRSIHPDAGEIDVDERGNIVVDENFQTSSEGVYAIGDVTGQPGFTHVSWEDYRRMYAILNGRADQRSRRDRPLSYALFTEPQLGRTGLTFEIAQEQGYDAVVATLPLNQVARASEIGKPRGFFRMVVDRETDLILGATLVSPNAAELIHIFVAHMESLSSWEALDRSVHIHPTFAEGLPELARKIKQKIKHAVRT